MPTHAASMRDGSMPGVGVGLEGRLDDEVLGRAVVVLAELAAADADHRDTVPDVHAGLAFQK